MRLPCIWVMLVVCSLAAGCLAPSFSSTKPVEATFSILSVARDPDAPFRYRGKVKVLTPKRYAGMEADLLVVSFQQGIEPFQGRTVRMTYSEGPLAWYLQPARERGPDVAPLIPTVYLEYAVGNFRELDGRGLSPEPIMIEGRIKSYHPDPTMYLQGHVFLSGDRVELEVVAPEKYRGMIFPIRASDPRWKNIGAAVALKTNEYHILFPWRGFVHESEIREVEFLPNG